jgi:hypothetical protein
MPASRFLVLALLSLGTAAACDNGPVDFSDPYGVPSGVAGGYRIVAPSDVSAGSAIPVVVRAETSYGAPDPAAEGVVRLSVAPGIDTLVTLKKGIGSTLLTPRDVGTLSLAVGGRARDTRLVRVVEPDTVIRVSGLVAIARWGAGVLWLVEDDVIVPAGGTLEVAAGARLAVAPEANLIVRGTLRINGTEENPVLIRPIDKRAPWGGIVVEGGVARIEGAFITGGGGDASRSFGHSDSQATVFGEAADVIVSHAWLMDNAGKGFGARGGRFEVNRTLVTRCDMGGEFAYATVSISDSHILDIPNGDGTYVDDDNDGLYFWAVNPESDLPSIVRNTYLVTGKDDGIDHNDARLMILDSWLEGFLHEGIAASSGHSVHIQNTVIRGNGQGVEAGYGNPGVSIDHSVIVENGVGVRFGDEYSTPSSGTMLISNSVLSGNDTAVLNFDPPADESGTVEFSRSMTDAGALTGCPDCLVASPVFVAGFYLHPASPGVGAGTDGSDLGRYRDRPSRMTASGRR